MTVVTIVASTTFQRATRPRMIRTTPRPIIHPRLNPSDPPESA
jgi:hypothetical protein